MDGSRFRHFPQTRLDLEPYLENFCTFNSTKKVVKVIGLERLLKTTCTEVLSVLLDEICKGYLTFLANKAHDVENLPISQNTRWSDAASTCGCDGNNHHSGVLGGKNVGTSSALFANNAEQFRQATRSLFLSGLFWKKIQYSIHSTCSSKKCFDLLLGLQKFDLRRTWHVNTKQKDLC